MSREEISQPKKYYTIVQGTFRTQVPQDHPEAYRRDWTSADGKKSGKPTQIGVLASSMACQERHRLGVWVATVKNTEALIEEELIGRG